MNNPFRKTIHLSYFASLREQRGLSNEHVDTNVDTADELYLELKNKHGFCFTKNSLKVSINDSLSSWQTELKTGDSVVFIPPVSGG